MKLVNFSAYEQQFTHFVETSDQYNELLKQKILTQLNQDHITNVFQLSVILLVWSFVMLLLEILVIPAALAYGVIHMVPTGYVPLAMLVVNSSIKYGFIHHYTFGALSRLIMIQAVIPYLGSGLLLAETLKDHPEFKEALKDFIRYKKKRKLSFRKQK